MSYAKRIAQVRTSLVQSVVTLSIIAALLSVALTACGAAVQTDACAQTAPLALASARPPTVPPAPTTSDPLLAEVRQRSALWNTAYAKRDANAFADLIAEDAQVTSGAGTAHGHSEVVSAVAKQWNHRDNVSWKHEPTDVQLAYDSMTASETGHWTETWNDLDGNAKLQGTYTFLWRRDKSTWRLTAAIIFPLTCTGESSYCKPPKN